MFQPVGKKQQSPMLQNKVKFCPYANTFLSTVHSIPKTYVSFKVTICQELAITLFFYIVVENKLQMPWQNTKTNKKKYTTVHTTQHTKLYNEQNVKVQAYRKFKSVNHFLNGNSKALTHHTKRKQLSFS